MSHQFVTNPECLVQNLSFSHIREISEWNKNLMKSADIAVFRTKAEAEKNFKFISSDEIIRKMKGICDG